MRKVVYTYCVYTLSIRGKIIYVGCSKDVFNRFCMHVNLSLFLCERGDMYNYIRTKALKRQYLRMQIIFKSRNQNIASLKEREYIKRHSTDNYLFNRKGNKDYINNPYVCEFMPIPKQDVINLRRKIYKLNEKIFK